MRVLVFGDSITQGYWDSQGGWVERLRHYYDGLQLKDLEHNDEPTIFNLGISADNSTDILGRIKHETSARVRHERQVQLLVQIGVNDSCISRDPSLDVSVDLPTYNNNLRAIASELKILPAKLIFVGLSACDESETIPVSWNDIDYTNKRIKEYEDSMKQVAQQLHIPFISVFDAFKARMDAGEDLMSDGLHPNNAGHKLIADIVRPELDKLLAG